MAAAVQAGAGFRVTLPVAEVEPIPGMLFAAKGEGTKKRVEEPVRQSALRSEPDFNSNQPSRPRALATAAAAAAGASESPSLISTSDGGGAHCSRDHETPPPATIHGVFSSEYRMAID